MTLFVLDTDILTLLESNHPVVRERCDSYQAQELALTVITVEEKLTGWYTLIRKAKKPEQLLHAYHRLAEAIDVVKPLRILRFSQTAFQRYEALKGQKLRIRKMDLCIAAIVLDADATLVTRNTQDFSKIPGLSFEDWTKPD